MAFMWLKGPGDCSPKGPSLGILVAPNLGRGSRYHPLRPSTLLVGMKDGEDPGWSDGEWSLAFWAISEGFHGWISSESQHFKNLGMAWGRFLLGRYLAFFLFFFQLHQKMIIIFWRVLFSLSISACNMLRSCCDHSIPIWDDFNNFCFTDMIVLSNLCWYPLVI